MSQLNTTNVNRQIQEQKTETRERIERQRQVLHARIFTSKGIPPHIVNGSLDDVRAYKEKTEKIGECYFLHNPPGQHHSLEGLQRVEDRLTNFSAMLSNIGKNSASAFRLEPEAAAAPQPRKRGMSY